MTRVRQGALIWAESIRHEHGVPSSTCGCLQANGADVGGGGIDPAGGGLWKLCELLLLEVEVEVETLLLQPLQLPKRR